MAPDLAWQPSLLDGGQPRLDVSYVGLRRIVLDERSWVDYCPGWLSGSDSVFELLASTARWQQRTVTMWEKEVLEPRLTAGWSTDAKTVPQVLAEMCSLLSDRYEIDFDSVWVNLYRDGQDSVAWHGDRNRLVMDRPMVATVSLGARRRFLLRPLGSSRIAHELMPGAGDLVVMGGACQQEWEHTVPKTAKSVGPRMSVTIRHSRPHPAIAT
ncbi:MAG TPA: alpha-ketoglutarate-dependent dioxygenase AlkB [Mycobacteriales bacterium]|nr:alpha-ketoglutarate-dependent dioxygenase AlkB [Mycobacteriales bacterium]